MIVFGRGGGWSVVQKFAKRFAAITLGLIVAVPVLAASWHTYLTAPVWWGVSYVLYRVSLRDERRALANLLGVLTGEFVWLLFLLADFPNSVALWAEAGAALALGVWWAVSQSRYAALTLIVAAGAWMVSAAC